MARKTRIKDLMSNNQKIVEVLLKAKKPLSASELIKEAKQSSGIIKAGLMVLKSKGIVEEKGDKLSINPETTNLDPRDLADFGFTTTEAKAPKTKAPKAKVPETKEKPTIIPRREKKKIIIPADDVLKRLIANVEGDFYTSTIATKLEWKPESIQDALVELANDGYLTRIQEEGLGEDMFTPTEKLMVLVDEYRGGKEEVHEEELAFDANKCAELIEEEVKKAEGHTTLAKLAKVLESSYTPEEIQIGVDYLQNIAGTHTTRRAGRGTVIESPAILQEIKDKKAAEEAEKARKAEEAKTRREAKAAREAEEAEAARKAEQEEAEAEAARKVEEVATHPVEGTDVLELVEETAANQIKDMSEMLSKYMAENMQLKHRLAVAQAQLKAHGIKG